MIIRIELKYIGRHGQTGKSHHHHSNGHENRYKAIVSLSKKLFTKTIPFFCKEISIQQANGKTEINNNRRNDALPPDIAHAVKIIVNGQ